MMAQTGEATQRVLDILYEKQAKAVFFVIGKNVEREPGLARRIVRQGHLLGNHSYSAGYTLAFQSRERIREDLARTNQIIQQTTQTKPIFFRPPNGIMTDALEAACQDLGLIPVGLHIFVNDSFSRQKNRTARRVLRQLKGGTLILVLHDGFGTRPTPSRQVTAEALALILDEAKRRGYRWGDPAELSGALSAFAEDHGFAR
jgi:peptidoglycan/xylan/chitin deacetylase (PgdA/CDA1 family)